MEFNRESVIYRTDYKAFQKGLVEIAMVGKVHLTDVLSHSFSNFYVAPKVRLWIDLKHGE